jgi:hypothetical protein
MRCNQSRLAMSKSQKNFSEYWEKGDDLAAFLLVAKVHPIIIIAYRSQSEPIPEGDLPRWKNFISITDYEERENKSILHLFSHSHSFLVFTVCGSICNNDRTCRLNV